jgi:hypothetical protein
MFGANRGIPDTPRHSSHLSEHPAKLEEPFVMAGVAYAAPDKEWADHRFGEYPCGNIVWEFPFVCSAVHFCKFIRADHEGSFPKQ